MFGRKKVKNGKRGAKPANAKAVETVSFEDAEDAEVEDILEERRRAQEPEEVYILVDEDGNEVEVPASELDQYEIVEEDDGPEDAEAPTEEADDIYRAAADIPAEDLFDEGEEDAVGETPGGEGQADAGAAEDADDTEQIEEPHEEERFVYVDEDGNEIELTEEELAEYEVVEEEADEPEDGAVYVYLDEDGNEIEVSADELDQYEVVEETQEERDRKHGRETYDKFQQATDDVNDIARSGISTARELKDAHDDIKGTFDDIKDLFSDFKK